MRFQRSVWALTSAAALGIAIFFTLYSLIPVTRAEEPSLSSLFLGTMMAFVMAVQVFTPALVRRLSLRGVVIASLATVAVGALTTGLSDGTTLLLAGAVASGSGFGVLIVAGAQGVALLVTREKLGRALGAYGLITMGAAAVGSPVGVQIALTFSPTVFGLCAVLIGLLGVGLAFGIPSTVGRHDPQPVEAHTAPERTAAQNQGKTAQLRTLVTGAPWLVLAVLLAAVMLLSHGLSSLPALAAVSGSAALVIFAVQAGNSIGRGIGGELVSRTTAQSTLMIGAALVAAGGFLGVLIIGSWAIIAAGALIGLGVGITQTVTLHVAMERMDSGHASVMWNLAVDGGLWVGGILWGLALSTGAIGPTVLITSGIVLVLGVMTVLQLSRPGGAGQSWRTIDSQGAA